MRYKLFGKSGLRVSELCLGTMTFGDEFGWGSSKEESRAIFDYFVEKGGNFFDTANYYTKGTSERYLGEFLRSSRKSHVIATKYTLNTNPKDPNAGGNHRKNLVQAVEESLERLGTDYIDIMWVHAWDAFTPIEEMMRALDDVIRQGKVLYIGASDTPAWVVSRANTYAELMGWTSFTGLQLEYSLIERTIEREFFDMARMLDLAILAWSPLGMGVLTGKYLSSFQKEGRFQNMESWKGRYVTERNTAIVQEVMSVAEKLNRSPAQVALSWIRQKNSRNIPIIGAKTIKQLEDNMACVELQIPDEDMKRLDELSAIELGFPQEFLSRDGVREIIHGEKLNLIDTVRMNT